MTRRQASVCFEIPYTTLTRRIWLGLPADRWFDPPIKWPAPAQPRRATRDSGAFLSPYGMLTLPMVAEAMGLRFGTIQSRLYIKSWSREEAFNTPSRGVRGVDFIMPPEEYKRRCADVLAREPARRHAKHLAERERERKRRQLHHRRTAERVRQLGNAQ